MGFTGIGFIGPAKAVPLLQSPFGRVFPQQVKPPARSAVFTARVNLCLDTKAIADRGFRRALKAVPVQDK
jgi:hypothetical protein